jgi:hypothetical protein
VPVASVDPDKTDVLKPDKVSPFKNLPHSKKHTVLSEIFELPHL